jgi:hypothetical protein
MAENRKFLHGIDTSFAFIDFSLITEYSVISKVKGRTATLHLKQRPMLCLNNFRPTNQNFPFSSQKSFE